MIASSEAVLTIAPARRRLHHARGLAKDVERPRQVDVDETPKHLVGGVDKRADDRDTRVVVYGIDRPQFGFRPPNAACTASESATSAPIVITRHRIRCTRLRAASRSSSGRDTSATSAPSRASASALASPMPEAAPVTSAMRPRISPHGPCRSRSQSIESTTPRSKVQAGAYPRSRPSRSSHRVPGCPTRSRPGPIS